MGNDTFPSIWLSTLQDTAVYGQRGETLTSVHAVSQNVLVQNQNNNIVMDAFNELAARVQTMELELIQLGKFVEHVESIHPGTLGEWLVTKAVRDRLEMDKDETSGN